MCVCVCVCVCVFVCVYVPQCRKKGRSLLFLRGNPRTRHCRQHTSASTAEAAALLHRADAAAPATVRAARGGWRQKCRLKCRNLEQVHHDTGDHHDCRAFAAHCGPSGCNATPRSHAPADSFVKGTVTTHSFMTGHGPAVINTHNVHAIIIPQ